MKVLITGAGGNLGRVLAPVLEEKGYEPILMDYRSVESQYTFIQGDVTNKEDVYKAVQGVDAIVHAAALHGIHLSNVHGKIIGDLTLKGHSIFTKRLGRMVCKRYYCAAQWAYMDIALNLRLIVSPLSMRICHFFLETFMA